jgi:outer membrane protein assembly factor BamE
VKLKNRLATLALLCIAAVVLAGCIYRIDVQQGNRLDESAIDQVEVGMTRSQVQFLLGTPSVEDAFHQGRWDYPYYLRHGRSRDIDARWVIVYFENDRVARIEKDAQLNPTS